MPDETLAIEMWKSRGRELNKLHEEVAITTRQAGLEPTAEDPVTDLRLIAGRLGYLQDEVDRLQRALTGACDQTREDIAAEIEEYADALLGGGDYLEAPEWARFVRTGAPRAGATPCPGKTQSRGTT